MPISLLYPGSHTVTPSLKVHFSVLPHSSKKSLCLGHVKFVENVFPIASPLTSTTPIIDSDFVLPAS